MPDENTNVQSESNTQESPKSETQVEPGTQTMVDPKPGNQILENSKPRNQTLDSKPRNQTVEPKPGNQTLDSKPGTQILESSKPGTQTVEPELVKDLENLRQQVNQLARQNLISEYKVPDRLINLVPSDLIKAQEFLESEQYKTLVADLAQMAELQAKLEALNHPQKVETTVVPDAKTEPAKSLPPKKWTDLTSSDFASIGSSLLNGL